MGPNVVVRRQRLELVTSPPRRVTQRTRSQASLSSRLEDTALIGATQAPAPNLGDMTMFQAQRVDALQDANQYCQAQRASTSRGPNVVVRRQCLEVVTELATSPPSRVTHRTQSRVLAQ